MFWSSLVTWVFVSKDIEEFFEISTFKITTLIDIGFSNSLKWPINSAIRWSNLLAFSSKSSLGYFKVIIYYEAIMYLK